VSRRGWRIANATEATRISGAIASSPLQAGLAMAGDEVDMDKRFDMENRNWFHAETMRPAPVDWLHPG